MGPTQNLFDEIKRAIEAAPRNGYVAEFHLQVIKYAESMQDVSSRKFCEQLGLKSTWGVEFSKMKKIALRLREAGLDPKRI